MTMAPKDKAGSSVDEREGAEIVTGAEASNKLAAVLQQFGFSASLFPLPSVSEFGFVEKTGFFWIKHPGRHEHTFPAAKIMLVYMQEVSGKLQKGKMMALKGWKMKPIDNKELFLSSSATEVWLDDPPSGNIHFHIARKTSSMSHKPSPPVKESFPVDVFAAAATDAAE